MDSSFELFDHTADIGVRVRAATQAGLIEPAIQGLYAVIGDLLPAGTARSETLALSGDDAAYLLRDYLAELLLALERRHEVFELDEVAEFSDQRLVVRGRMSALDSQRSVLEREVKAVTYHELSVRRVADGYEAVFIVDI